MKNLIVYAHPWDGSFNKFVLDKVKANIIEKGEEVDVIDLNKDGFNPVMQEADLAVFAQGEYADELARNYAERIVSADNIIFIFPIWWYGEPAILKGFYDKVFIKGQVYKDNPDKTISGLLKSNSATIITTANIDKTIFTHLGDPIQNVLANGILRTAGIENVKWIHCPTVHLEESRKEFLNKIDKHFA